MSEVFLRLDFRRRAEAQRKEGNVELKEAKEEIARKDAEISLAQDQAKDLREMQDLLEGWDTGSGKIFSGSLAKVTNAHTSICLQESFRICRMC